MSQASSARRLMAMLTVYFVLFFGSLFAIGTMKPELTSVMPFGGTDAIAFASIDVEKESFVDQITGKEDTTVDRVPTVGQIVRVGLFLAVTLAGTVLVMLPITWTYIAANKEIGYRKNFVRALMVLPICATTIVLLIQDNLALAFGLAAMVAAVRFRVSLREAIDGIYIFSSICVGLAAGIGYLGIAAIMAAFFCYTNAVLWIIEFGKNPIDEARIAKNHAALEMTSPAKTTQQMSGN
jgi:hypothetical protein